MARAFANLQPTEGEDQPETVGTVKDPLQGVPGDVEPEKPAAPQLKEVTINGRKFQVDADMAQAMAERDRSIDQKLSEHSQELGNLRKFYQAHAPQTQEKPKGYDVLLFEDPIGAVNKIKEEIRQEYRAEKSLESFWTDFYRDNRDVLNRDEDHFIVESLATKHFNDLVRLPVVDQIKKLGELSREQILRYQQRGQLDDNGSPPLTRTRVESPSHSNGVVPAKEPEGPSTLTDIIKAQSKAKSRGAVA